MRASGAAVSRAAVGAQISALDARRLWARTLRPALTPGSILRWAILLFFLAITAYPLVLVVSTALKNPTDVTLNPFSLFSSVRLENFSQTWDEGGFSSYFWNTVLITVPSVALIVALSVAGGYALARLPFPGRNVIFYLFMLGLMIP